MRSGFFIPSLCMGGHDDDTVLFPRSGHLTGNSNRQ